MLETFSVLTRHAPIHSETLNVPTRHVAGQTDKATQVMLETINVSSRHHPSGVWSTYFATAIKERQNTILCVHTLLEFSDFTVVMDHEASNSICHRDLGLVLNLLLAQVIFTVTASLRYGGALHVL